MVVVTLVTFFTFSAVFIVVIAVMRTATLLFEFTAMMGVVFRCRDGHIL